jgi:hypothetical protein
MSSSSSSLEEESSEHSANTGSSKHRSPQEREDEAQTCAVESRQRSRSR